MSKEKLDKWVGVSIFAAKELNAIHPDDLQLFSSDYKYRGLLHKCVSVEGEYLIVNYLEQSYRIKPDSRCVSFFSPPKFQPLEKVKYISSKGRLEFGVVVGISWHNNENRHIYFLEVNGKKKSRRYHAEDLQKIEE